MGNHEDSPRGLDVPQLLHYKVALMSRYKFEEQKHRFTPS